MLSRLFQTRRHAASKLHAQAARLAPLVLPAWAACVLWPAEFARAGYEAPCHIDGCRSADGRYVVTAALVPAADAARVHPVHGPHRWEFTWKDTQTGLAKTFPAQGVQAGQVYAQLFVAPDGQTFALWNHVTLWTPGKSEMHGPQDLPYQEDSPAWRARQEFSRRLIIYRHDGSIIKELGVADFLRADEWPAVSRVFNRVEWLRPFDNLNYKNTPRPQYAFYRVSPDYTVLEFLVVPPRSAADKTGRRARVSLTDGRVLPEDAVPEGPAKTPARPFVGDDHLPSPAPAWKENYAPSLDPARKAGTYRVQTSAEAFPRDKAPKQPAFAWGPARLLAEGYAKADTPAWLPNAQGGKSAPGVVFTDLDQGKLFLLTPPDTAVVEVRGDLGRGKVGPDKRFYGVWLSPRPGAAATGAEQPAAEPVPMLASWLPGEEPRVVVEKAAGGRALSLNDLAISSRGLIYVTTLKDPDMGRLSLVDPARKTATVLFDGEQEPNLANPNGVALSNDERFLFVGISNYKNRKHSGVYCFPILPDGGVDLAGGKARPWAPVPGPDGLAVDRDGNLFFTAGGAVEAFDRFGRRWGSIKIPKGAGTNLCFGGEQGETLYITTFNALYAATKAK